MRALTTALLAAALAISPVLPTAAQEAAAPAAPRTPPVASAPVPNPVAAARPRIVRAPATTPPSPLDPPLVAPSLLPTQPTGARLAVGEPIPQAELEAYVDGVVKSAMSRDH